jgi:hypothetical protein
MTSRHSPSAPRWRPWLLLLILLVVAASAYWWRVQARNRPLTYRIGSVDARFGLSREAFAESVAQAAGLWKQAVPRELFREAPDGVIEISLVYDSRQEAADRLKALNLKLDDTQGSYESLKAHFETLRGEAKQKGDSLAQDFAAYNDRVAAFNAQGAASRRAPLPEGEYRRLEAERAALAEAKEGLQRRQEELKRLGESLQGLVVVINDLAARHNLDLVDIDRTGKGLGPEFSEGEYVQKDGRRSITIYHFPSREGLVRVLAHELGHAKGLGHLENPLAVMHRLMRTQSLELTADDIAAMKAEAGR